jgi:hypothetical protein
MFGQSEKCEQISFAEPDKPRSLRLFEQRAKAVRRMKVFDLNIPERRFLIRLKDTSTATGRIRFLVFSPLSQERGFLCSWGCGFACG